MEGAIGMGERDDVVVCAETVRLRISEGMQWVGSGDRAITYKGMACAPMAAGPVTTRLWTLPLTQSARRVGVPAAAGAANAAARNKRTNALGI